VQRKALHVARKAEELHEWSASRRLDGYLHLPEYGLLLDPPLAGAVDVHAFGECEGTRGIWHAVVPSSVSIEAEKVKLEPNGADAKCRLEDKRAICVERIDGMGDITVSTHPSSQNGQLCLSHINVLISVSD
jgi:hypothetical protein